MHVDFFLVWMYALFMYVDICLCTWGGVAFPTECTPSRRLHELFDPAAWPAMADYLLSTSTMLHQNQRWQQTAASLLTVYL